MKFPNIRFVSKNHQLLQVVFPLRILFETLQKKMSQHLFLECFKQDPKRKDNLEQLMNFSKISRASGFPE